MIYRYDTKKIELNENRFQTISQICYILLCIFFSEWLQLHALSLMRRVWRYERGNQNLYIKEEQTTECPKENVQKDKQRSTKHTQKN